MKTHSPFSSHKSFCQPLLTALLLAPLVALHAAETPPPALSPEEPQRFRAAAEYSRSAHGVSVLVMRRGEIVFEDYAPGWADKPHELASGTKSFSGVMAVCAVQDGLLKLDEKASDTLTEWKVDPRKSQVTIRQLLSLSSGIEGGENGAPPMYRRAIVEAEATADAGTRFSYGPIPFQCFGELMRRKLEPRKESVEAYLKRRIFAPIGLQVGTWAKDREDNLRMPSGASLTAREWAKFGELIRLGDSVGKEFSDTVFLSNCRPIRKHRRKTGIRVLSMNPESSTSPGHTARAQGAAPQGVVISGLQIEAARSVPVYLAPGVTGALIEDCVFTGWSVTGAIYLDAESGGKVEP